jgi:hypothetical protein
VLEHHRREETDYLVFLPLTNSFIQLKSLNLSKSQHSEKGHPNLLGRAYHHSVGDPGSAEGRKPGGAVGWSVDLTAASLPFHLLPAVDSLGISDELKEKLEDVLIPEQQFTLGRMLGKGAGAVGD